MKRRRKSTKIVHSAKREWYRLTTRLSSQQKLNYFFGITPDWL
jgi:hypothetical protein